MLKASCLKLKTKKMKTKSHHAKTIEARKGKTFVEETSLGHLTQKTPSSNTSGQKGVFWNKRDKKWQSEIMIKGKAIRLGRYDNKQDAINARLEAEEKYFKEYNRNNRRKYNCRK